MLLQCGVDVDSGDIDGWTPLHAGAHWGQEEVCSLLADNMCNMTAVNNVVSCEAEPASARRKPLCKSSAFFYFFIRGVTNDAPRMSL